MEPGDRTLAPKIEVGLEVRDEAGDLVEEKREAVNLATDNWITLMEALHTVVADDNNNKALLTDDQGSADGYLTADTAGDWFYDTNQGSVGPFIAIGDGGGSSVTPARDNHKLDNRLDRKQAGTPSKGSDSVTISATFTNNTGSSFTVRETGMFLAMTDGNLNKKKVLMYHDAVSATSVADGNSVTVTYSFTWP